MFLVMFPIHPYATDKGMIKVKEATLTNYKWPTSKDMFLCFGSTTLHLSLGMVVFQCCFCSG